MHAAHSLTSASSAHFRPVCLANSTWKRWIFKYAQNMLKINHFWWKYFHSVVPTCIDWFSLPSSCRAACESSSFLLSSTTLDLERSNSDSAARQRSNNDRISSAEEPTLAWNVDFMNYMRFLRCKSASLWLLTKYCMVDIIFYTNTASLQCGRIVFTAVRRCQQESTVACWCSPTTLLLPARHARNAS